MGKVAVVTDSSACVPKEVVRQYGIHILPLILIFEDRSYRDGVDITAQEFYELLKKAKKVPTTSSPSPGEYLEAFREVARQASSILCITLPPNLSMAFDSATQAREMAREALPHVDINVFPSHSPALAQGFIAQAAARAAASGKDLSQVVQAAQYMMDRVNAIAMLDTLYYLAKGGRIPKAAAWAGSLFKIKPILDATGEVRLLERCRTRKRAIQRLLYIMRQRSDSKPICVNLMHAGVPEEAERLKADILAQFDCLEFYVTDFTPVVGTHTGPGTIGLSFYVADSK
jgi:fatty acid kinase fatty acid binding subunit